MKLENLKQLSSLFRPPLTPTQYSQIQDHLRQIGLDPDNLYQELEMSYRYVQAHQDISFSNAIVSLHSHNFFEILYCRNTCGAEYLVGATRYRLQKGDVVIVPPGISHRPLLPEIMEEPYIRDVLWLSAEFIEMLRRMFPDLEFPLIDQGTLLRTSDSSWEYLGEIIRGIVTESEQQNPGWSSVVIGNAIALVTHLQRAEHSRDTATVRAEKPDLLEQVLAYVEAHLSARITLEDIAQQFYVSKSTVTQLFRKKMGVSFYRCVTQRRLITAKQLIEAKLPMESVAEKTGFSDYSAFYRAFRKEYGINPRQYRLMQSENTQ